MKTKTARPKKDTSPTPKPLLVDDLLAVCPEYRRGVTIDHLETLFVNRDLIHKIDGKYFLGPKRHD